MKHSSFHTHLSGDLAAAAAAAVSAKRELLGALCLDIPRSTKNERAGATISEGRLEVVWFLYRVPE